MQNSNVATVSLLIALAASVLAACERTTTGASAGQQLDQTASQAGRKIGEVMERIDSKIDEHAKKTAAVLDDVEITARVKAAIFAEPGLKILQIGVETAKGVVNLTGSVDTPADRELANSLAGAVGGVKEVTDQLVVKPPKTAGQQ